MEFYNFEVLETAPVAEKTDMRDDLLNFLIALNSLMILFTWLFARREKVVVDGIPTSDYNKLVEDHNELVEEKNKLEEKVSEEISDYNQIVEKHNSLVEEFEKLQEKNEKDVSDYNELVEKHNALLEENAELIEKLDESEKRVGRLESRIHRWF